MHWCRDGWWGGGDHSYIIFYPLPVGQLTQIRGWPHSSITEIPWEGITFIQPLPRTPLIPPSLCDSAYAWLASTYPFPPMVFHLIHRLRRAEVARRGPIHLLYNPWAKPPPPCDPLNPTPPPSGRPMGLAGRNRKRGWSVDLGWGRGGGRGILFLWIIAHRRRKLSINTKSSYWVTDPPPSHTYTTQVKYWCRSRHSFYLFCYFTYDTVHTLFFLGMFSFWVFFLPELGKWLQHLGK